MHSRRGKLTVKQALYYHQHNFKKPEPALAENLSWNKFLHPQNIFLFGLNFTKFDPVVYSIDCDQD